jgi:membrane protease YdiL (CAAX protease family)
MTMPIRGDAPSPNSCVRNQQFESAEPTCAPTGAELSYGGAWLDVAVALLTAFGSYYILEPVVGQWLQDPDSPSDPVLDLFGPRTAATVLTVAVAAFLLLSRGLKPRTIGLKRQGVGEQAFAGVCSVPFALAAAAVAYGLTLLLRYAAGSDESLAAAREAVGQIRDAGQLGRTIAFLAIAALNEEVIFRGLILTRLRRICGQWPTAVIISSMLFGAIHLNFGMAYARNAFCLSIVWSCLYIRTGSLLSTTVGHFLFNCTLLLLPKIFGWQ